MDEKIEKLLSSMTLEEKASLCSGLNFWETKPVRRMEVPSITFADGPHGLRKENQDDDNVGLKASFPATSFPPAVNIASTWNPKLAYEMGVVLSEQCKNQDIQTLLGPGTNIKRSPLCGRNFEYFSEDPFLAGEMCVPYIEGVQIGGIGTSLKHFAANSQEYLRFVIDEIIDERALREIYLPAFEAAVKRGKPWTVMCSYNRLNGVHLSDNKKMLTDILREEWGFEGIVISDWNALNKRIPALLAGMDLEMPSSGSRTDGLIIQAVNKGELDIEVLNASTRRMLKFLLTCEKSMVENYNVDYEDGHKIARKIADESIVLLKNDNNVLPHKITDEFTIIGELARDCRYQGSGSSQINPYRLVNLLSYLDDHKVNYNFYPAYTFDENSADQRLFDEAVEAAKNAKKILLFVGLPCNFENEGIDRLHMNLPDIHNKLVDAILDINPDATIVLTGGAPVELPWANKATTLLNAYLPGEAFGESVSDILFGKISPSGKLAETYPIKLEDNIVSKYYRGGPRTVEHRESIFVGYRYFDTAKREVAFPFGHGLSYSSFSYSEPFINCTIVGDKNIVTAGVKVTNTGNYDAAEVVQLYVHDPVSTIFKAEKELKGFEKVFLKKGECQTVSFELDNRSFSYYNTKINDWHIEGGEYQVWIGASSRDIKFKLSVELQSSDGSVSVPDYKKTSPVYYNLATANEIPTEDFEGLYGKTLPINRSLKRGEFDLNATIQELQCCIPGKVISKVAPMFIKGQMPNADFTTMLLMTKVFKEMPVRALNGISSGLVDPMVPEGIVLWANKHRLRGFFRMIRGFILCLGNVVRENKLRHAKQEKRRTREAQKQLEKELNLAKEEQIKALKEEIKNKKEETKEEIKSAIKESRVETKTAIKAINDDIKSIKKEVSGNKSTEKENDSIDQVPKKMRSSEKVKNASNEKSAKKISNERVKDAETNKKQNKSKNKIIDKTLKNNTIEKPFEISKTGRPAKNVKTLSKSSKKTDIFNDEDTKNRK